MFTRKLQITIILILITSVCLSQPTKKNFEKMIDQKCKFIKTELQLTEDQDKAFMPISREFELKRKELHDKKRDLLKLILRWHNWEMNIIKSLKKFCHL